MQSLKLVKRQIIGGIIALGLFLGVVSIYFNVARTASVPPGISTPTSFIVTLKKAELQAVNHGDYRYVISNSPADIDIVSNTGKSTAMFKSGTAPFNTYHGVRLTLAGTAKFSGIDPCTGDDVTDVPVQLPESENDEYIMQYEVPHPVLGLLSGAKAYQQYALTADNRISPLEFRVVFPLTNSIACISDTPLTQKITGTSTGISTPYSITFDTDNSEIGITNNGANSVNFYRRSDSGDILPLRTIQGSSTELNAPRQSEKYTEDNDD